MAVGILREATWDSIIESYELQRKGDSAIRLEDYLPDSNTPDFLPILEELIRVDLELSYQEGTAKTLEEYLSHFPMLRKSLRSIEAIGYEEYRQKLLAGIQVNPESYHSMYGIDISQWPENSLADIQPRRIPVQANSDFHSQVFPKAGETFLDFELIEEIGRGSFARVFLARQPILSDRQIVLKISRIRFSDASALARLQHTNIVPVFSVHRQEALEAVCMPFLGRRTAKDLIQILQTQTSIRSSAEIRIDTLSEIVPHTIIEASAGNSVPQSSDANALSASKTTVAHKSRETSFVDATLMTVRKLALALSHAHQRGIIHRDLKPANVLLADDGEPMLLDFNLSRDLLNRSDCDRDVVGGTLPYMSPEQLDEFEQQIPFADCRSDIFSLGILLYEFLFGVTPYPNRTGSIDDVVRQMRVDRRSRSQMQNLRHDLRVSPAVHSIIDKCLAPDPLDRYQDASQLAEDLLCQTQNLPLKFAENSSLIERSQKWFRRHPRLSSAGGITIFASIVLACLVTTLTLRTQRLNSLQAQATFQDFRHQLHGCQKGVIEASTAEFTAVENAIIDCERVLTSYEFFDNPSWHNSLKISYLPLTDQKQLLSDIGDLLFMRAMMYRQKIDFARDDDQRHNAVCSAIKADELAASYNLGQPKSPSMNVDCIESSASNTIATKIKPSRESDITHYSSNELCRQACLLVSQRRFAESLPLWTLASTKDRDNSWIWFGLGYAQEHSGDLSSAAESYTACIALTPDYFGWYFNRGRLRLLKGDSKGARNDFEAAKSLYPQHAETHVNLAIAALDCKDYDAALESTEIAARLGYSDPQTLLIQSRAYMEKGDKQSAQMAKIEAERVQPRSAQAWVARGAAIANSAPHQAIKDFDEAMLLNAYSLSAMESKAYVLSDVLLQISDAIKVLDRAIELFPENASIRASRGVLLARSGQSENALKDAQDSLALQVVPAVEYRVACIYALLSDQSESFRKRALELLTSSISHGYGAKYLGADNDLDALREDPDFLAMCDAIHFLDLEKGDGSQEHVQ